MNPTSTTLTNHQSDTPPGSLGILLRRELAERGGTYRIFGILWLVGLWIVPVFSDPLFFLWLGLIFVFLFTPSQTGVDVLDGTEEFTFTRPPTRADVFLSRMLPSAVFLFATGFIGGLAIGFDLPQRLWSLVFSGGLTRPFAPVKDVYWYSLSILIPLAAHTIAGGFAALAGTRQQVLWAGLVGVIGAWAIAGIGLALEHGLSDRAHGWISTPVLLAATAGLFALGFRAYQGKEATRAGAPTSTASSRRGGDYLSFFILLLVVIVLLVFSLFWDRKSEPASMSREAESFREEMVRDNENRLVPPLRPGSN